MAVVHSTFGVRIKGLHSTFYILFYILHSQTKASAFGSILARWGASITWVVQREFSAQILRAFESSIAAADFIKTFEAPVASVRTA